MLLGGLLSASLVWVASGLVSARPDPVALAVVCAVAVLAVCREAGIVGFRLPENARQVPQTVFYKGKRPAALQFGFEMGTGVRTYTPTAAPYVVVAAILMLGGPAPAALAGLGFGSGRALMPLSRSISRADRNWDDRLKRRGRAIALSSTAVCAVAACCWAIGVL